MIDARSIQADLKKGGFYSGTIDGALGPKSQTAISTALTKLGVKHAAWTPERRLIAYQQYMMSSLAIDVGKVDGISGPLFQYGLELWQNKMRDVEAPPEVVAHKPTVWPRQAEVVKFYGQPGDSKNQTKLKTPYPLYLDWDLRTRTTAFSIHQKCHDSALRVMNRVLSHYGEERIHELGLDQFGGCLNVRKMRGGSSWSMHAWGIAIDWDADRNPLRSTAKSARFSLVPETHKFLDLWEEEGWTSLGRDRNYDWMHVQAARL